VSPPAHSPPLAQAQLRLLGQAEAPLSSREWLARVSVALVRVLASRVWASLVPVLASLPRVQAPQGWEPGPQVWVSA